MKVEPRFLTGDGPEIFTGNELLLKGALETDGGVHLLGGYPGSPISGFFDALSLVRDLLIEKGIRAVINNNEALAAAMLNGSQVIGCRSMIVIKSVGVHVAADALALGNLAGAHPEGGAIVVYGDDPWSDSTQVAADSRYISQHLFTPVIEPSNPQEIKDFVDSAFKLSRRAELYAGYLLTNNLADGGGTVQCRPNQFPDLNTRNPMVLDTAAIDLDKFVLLPPKTWWQEEALAERFARAKAAAAELGINRIDYPADERKPIGFATSGLAHGYLLQTLLELDLLGDYPILKFGMSYPVDEALVRRMARQCRRLIVVEERRGFMEDQISRIVLGDRQMGGPAADVEVWGKRFPDGLRGIPETRGLHPSILISRLVPLLKAVRPTSATAPAAGTPALDREIDTIDATAQAEVGKLPARVASFCAGCPHRDTASLCLEIRKRFMDAAYMRRRHGSGPVDLLFHGDTGCYTMLMFPPNTSLMQDYSGMGLGGGTGSGTDPFLTNKQAVFMGDSTFFHSGQIAISQAIKLGQDITFIILDNRTTAMTGHQPTPGVGYDVLGCDTAVQDIEDVINGIASGGEIPVVRVDPEKRKEYRHLLEETLLRDGVKVIIADKECGITRLRRRQRLERAVTRRLGYLPRWEHTNINQEICRFCLACAELAGCPGLKHVETEYGRKMDTDVTRCVSDGACERVRACSSFERVTIKRKRPPRPKAPDLGLDKIPEPEKRPVGDVWRCCLTGVGGMGAGVATRILVRAGHKEGCEVLFLDKKGLAIRNGGVVSQVVYNLARRPLTAIIPYGKADLLLGVDILEAARTLDPAGRMRVASKRQTAAVINTDKMQTISGIMGREDFDPEELEQLIRRYTRSEDFLARNIAAICERYLGSKLYANIMMLGFAFQNGLIPVSMHSMAWAIKETISAQWRKNLLAFNMGRKLVTDHDLFRGPPQRADWRKVLDDKCRYTVRRYRHGQELAQQLRELTAEAMGRARDLEEPLKRAMVVRMYDCMRWGGMAYARRYADQVRRVYEKDRAELHHAATRAVIHNLADAMLIKDGVFLAELATCREKFSRDRDKYNVNPANGDRIVYRYLWHPTVRIGPWKVDVDFAARTWMLRCLKRMKFLRKLLHGWHAAERAFLARYEGWVAAFDYDEAEQYRAATARLSSPRCLDCMNPACSEEGCPLASRVPEWVQLACEENWRAAAEKLHEANNFPEFTGLLCPAPCQDACKRGLNRYPVQIRDIERRIAEEAFANGWAPPRVPQEKTGRKVAIVGSGPAGLAAAQQLARAGHDVTVFEKDDQPGGLLRYGIPSFRLDRKLIDRRLDQLRAEGVQFRTAACVGRDVSAEELRRDFDAVCLAAGTPRPRELDVPGRNHKGVLQALDYLRRAGADDEDASARGKVVAVLGAGLTGEDCVDTAVAQGAAEVHQFEILPRSGAPGGKLPATETRDEVVRRWSVAAKAFGGDGERLTDIQAVRVHWVHSDNGPVMTTQQGTEFRTKVDMAVLALGFEPAIAPDLAESFGLATDASGKAVVRDGATSVPGVFAAGDLVTGPSYIVTAIDSGRRAAAKIDAYLAAKV